MGIGNIPKTATGFGLINWPFSVATIPSGFTRYTPCDGKYLQGADIGVDPGGTGGSINHNHLTDAHNMLEDSHPHILSTNSAATGSIAGASSRFGMVTARDAHTHPDTNSASTTGINQSKAAFSTSTNINLPPTITSIRLKPDDGNQKVPVDGVVFCSKTKIEGNFRINDGTNGTVDMDGLFVRCPSAGADGGVTAGGPDHSHRAAHTHVKNSHLHTDSNYGVASLTLAATGTGLTSVQDVHHQAQSILGTVAVNDSDNTASSTSTNEPRFKELLAIQNKGNSQAIQDRTVLEFTGPISEIPKEDGWFLMDGNNGTLDLQSYQVKVTTNTADIGNPGGDEDNLHTHTIIHNHVVQEHDHLFTVAVINTQVIGSGAVLFSTTGHGHGVDGIKLETTVITNQSATITMDMVDGRQPFIEVVFIQLNLTRVHIKGKTHIKGSVAIAAN